MATKETKVYEAIDAIEKGASVCILDNIDVIKELAQISYKMLKNKNRYIFYKINSAYCLLRKTTYLVS